MSGLLFQLSHSKIASFHRCRKQYWFRHLSGLPTPPSEPSPAGIIGIGVHRAMKALCETGEAEDGRTELDAYLRMPVHECAAPGTEHYATAFRLYERGCEAHTQIESEDRWAEIDRWLPDTKRGIAVQARIDRADRLSADRWQVIDWKTGRYDIDEVVDGQLDIAHLVLRYAHHLPYEATVRALSWNLRTGAQRVRELRRDDAAAVIQRCARTARRMQSISVFEATPSIACRFCEWRPQCPEAAAIEAGEWDDDLTPDSSPADAGEGDDEV